MATKIGEILGSLRFWQLVVIGAIFALVDIGIIDGATAEAVAQAITLVLGGSVTIGTLDSVARRFAGAK